MYSVGYRFGGEAVMTLALIGIGLLVFLIFDAWAMDQKEQHKGPGGW